MFTLLPHLHPSLPLPPPAGAPQHVPSPAVDVHQDGGPRPARLLLRPAHPPHRRLPHRQGRQEDAAGAGGGAGEQWGWGNWEGGETRVGALRGGERVGWEEGGLGKPTETRSIWFYSPLPLSSVLPLLPPPPFRRTWVWTMTSGPSPTVWPRCWSGCPCTRRTRPRASRCCGRRRPSTSARDTRAAPSTCRSSTHGSWWVNVCVLCVYLCVCVCWGAGPAPLTP